MLFVAATYAHGTSIACPAGYAAGDLLLLHAVGRPTTPSGWTALGQDGSTARHSMFAKISSGSEGTVSVSAATMDMSMAAYRTGVILPTVFSGTVAEGTVFNSGTVSLPALASSGAAVIAGFTLQGVSAWTAGSGMTVDSTGFTSSGSSPSTTWYFVWESAAAPTSPFTPSANYTLRDSGTSLWWGQAMAATSGGGHLTMLV